MLWLGKNWHWQGRQLPSYIKREQLKNHSPLFTWFYVTNGAFGHGWCKQVYFGSQKRRVGPTTLTQHFNIKSRSNLLVDLDRNTHKECSSPNFDKRTWLSINSFFLNVRIGDNRFSTTPCTPAWWSLLVRTELKTSLCNFDSLAVWQLVLSLRLMISFYWGLLISKNIIANNCNRVFFHRNSSNICSIMTKGICPNHLSSRKFVHKF